MKMFSVRQRGFTLIEILIVIGIIAILAAVVIVAINPARQFAQANNSQRSSNVNTVLNAVHQYAIDKKGKLPTGIPDPVQGPGEICGDATCAGLVDLSVLTANQTYIADFPHDPLCDFPNDTPGVCAAHGIGYKIVQSTNGRITVNAPAAELGVVISVTR